MIGVSKAVKDSDVRHATDAEQDAYIREVAVALSVELRMFTGEAMPISEATFEVKGPVDDPLQGLIHVHTLAAHYDLDTLPTDSDAYAVHVGRAQGSTDQGTTQEFKP